MSVMFFGSKMIDLMHPHPDEIDLKAVDARLRQIVRYSGHPRALTVHQHQFLVQNLVYLDRDYDFDSSSRHIYEDCFTWAKHHDDHEALMGDIISPLKRLINDRTTVLETVENRLDMAIAHARGIKPPSEMTKGIVYRYDIAAGILEWLFGLEMPEAAWTGSCPERFKKQGRELIEWARARDE